jgi:hypothetical protein
LMTFGICNHSVSSTRCYRAHPLAARFLPRGLLRASRLRSSTCQGKATVTRRSHSLHQVRCRTTNTNFAGIQVLLHRPAEIFQRRHRIVTKCSLPGTRHIPSNGNTFRDYIQLRLQPALISANYWIRRAFSPQQGGGS